MCVTNKDKYVTKTDTLFQCLLNNMANIREKEEWRYDEKDD